MVGLTGGGLTGMEPLFYRILKYAYNTVWMTLLWVFVGLCMFIAATTCLVIVHYLSVNIGVEVAKQFLKTVEITLILGIGLSIFYIFLGGTKKWQQEQS